MGLRAPAAPAAPKPVSGAGQAPSYTPEAAAVPPAADPPAAAVTPPAGTATPPGDPAVPPAATDPKPEDDPRFAPKFAALARKERGLQEREVKVKATEGELAAYNKAKADAKLDPIALLRAHGWEYDTVTQFVLNDGQLTDAQRLKILQDEQAAARTTAETQAEQTKREQAQRAAESHMVALKAYVDTNADTYKHIRVNDAYDLVYEVQESHYRKTFNKEANCGEIMAFDTAANMVEDYLLGKHKKVLEMTQGSEPGAPPSAVTPPASSPTLTNRMHGTSTPTNVGKKMLSDDESKREAAKLLRFT